MEKRQLEPSDDWGRAQAEMDRLYQEMVVPGRWVVVRHAHAWRPPTDVYETDENVVVRVEVAGMKETDLSVSLADRMLIITGVRHDPSPKVAYHQMEIRYGDFRTEIFLHWAVEQEDIVATYTDGFLQVTLPKVGARRVRVVQVNDESAD
jgi:HSP20 family protein